MSAEYQSFHLPTIVKSAMAAIIGLESGIIIFIRIRNSPAPSILADSRILGFIPAKNVLNNIRLYAVTTNGMTITAGLSIRCSPFIRR